MFCLTKIKATVFTRLVGQDIDEEIVFYDGSCTKGLLLFSLFVCLFGLVEESRYLLCCVFTDIHIYKMASQTKKKSFMLASKEKPSGE